MTIHDNALYSEVGNRVRHRVEVGLEKAPRFYPRLCTAIDSTQEIEDYDWLGAFPEVYEWLGDMVFDQISSAEFQIRNKDWANGIRLPKKKISDGNSGYFERMADGLVEMFTRHPDKELFKLMTLAEQIECFDGQFFFDTDHVWGDSGVQSNLLTINVTDPAAPTTEELLDAVTQVLLNMLSYKNDRGEPFVFPTAHDFSDLVITCSPQLWPIFDKAFQAKLVLETNAAGTAGAAVDKYTLTRPEIIPLVQYTGNQFDVYRTGQAIKPFVFQDREKIQMFTKNYDDPEGCQSRWQRSVRTGRVGLVVRVPCETDLIRLGDLNPKTVLQSSCGLMPNSVLTVTRHPGKKNPFHRAVRNRKGKVEKLLRFEPDQPVPLSESEADLVTKDIGRALVIIEPDETRPGRFIVDWETTRKVFAEIHNEELEVSPRARRAIGSSDTPPANVIDVRRKPAKATADNPGGDGAAGQADETAIELPDELVDLLEKHGEVLPSPLSVDGLTQWIKDGGELMLLDGFTIDSATAVHDALGLDALVVENADDSTSDAVADQSKLIEAGLSQELVDALAKNASEHPWVMDPEQIKAKVGEGFDLTKLADIANGRSKQIRTALAIVEQK